MSDHMGLTSLFVCVRTLHSSDLSPEFIQPFLFCRPCVSFSSFLSEQLSQDVAEMLLVVRREVEEDGSWLNPDNPKK